MVHVDHNLIAKVEWGIQCDHWVPLKQCIQKVDVAEMKMLKWIYGVIQKKENHS